MTAPAELSGEYAEKDNEVERCRFDWVIPDFRQIFPILNHKEPRPERSADGSITRRPTDDSKCKLYSETFVRGQLVQRTSLWQLELRKNVTYLSVGLCCLRCFHENVDEIWTQFDTDIVDLNGKCLYSVNASDHYNRANATKFTPNDRNISDKQDAKKKGRSSFWETDLMRMCKLAEDLEKYVPRGILNLRLRLYIYKREPFNEAHHLSEYRDPVKLCYTDTTCDLVTNSSSKNPLLNAVKNMWNTKDDADVSFSVEGNIVKAHRFIISVQSPTLKGIINSQTGSSLDTPILISDMGRRSFEQVLKYLYLHDAEDLKESSDIQYIAEVLTACTRLNETSLGRICCVRLLLNMNPDNFVDTAMNIYKNVTNDPSFFKREIGKYFFENQAAIRDSTAFKQQIQSCKDFFMDIYFGFTQME